MNDMKQDGQKSSAIPGIVVFGCFVVGFAGLIAAGVGMFEFEDPTGAGVCLVASAIAFGLAANAIFRK